MVIFFISCSKDDDEFLLSDVIVGSWFAVSSEDESGTLVYAEASSAITLTFMTDGTYEWDLSYTNSSAEPITYTRTYTYDDDEKTIELKGKAYIGSYSLTQDDTWTVSKLSSEKMKIWEDTGIT